MPLPKTLLVIIPLVAIVFICARCMSNGNMMTTDPRGDRYAGSQTCVRCHKNIATSYSHTNHFKTSSPASSSELKKQAGLASDTFSFADSSKVHIEEKENHLYQTAVGKNGSVRAAFAIAFGSGEKAQTYGYWKGDQLYQLPLTWFTSQHAWANSPGFPNTSAYYDRVIISRCFECHASYVEVDYQQKTALATREAMDSNSIVFGIDCERCHGPAATHVNFHKEHPQEKKPMFVTSWKALSRQQQLDACAVCHSGNDKAMQRSTFAFIPGDTLSHFSYPEFGAQKNAEPDVHGKQMQLLQSSACFKAGSLVCTSCHNPHETEKNQLASFSAKCLGCHSASAHAQTRWKEIQSPATAMPGQAVKNCIDCHMPLQQSKDIFFGSGAKMQSIPYMLRTHRIAVY